MAPDLQGILAEQQLDDENREQSFALQKKIIFSTNKLLDNVRNGELADFSEDEKAVRDMQKQMLDCIRHDAVVRENRVSGLIERALVPAMLFQFYSTGAVPTQKFFGHCNDDEYIGALTGFAQELCRYVVNRACENDAESIEISRLTAIQLNEALLSLDFRNGPLRRKYDGVKYAVRSIEGTAFELSLAASELAPALFSDKEDASPASKRVRLEIVAEPSQDAIAASEEVTAVARSFIDKEEIGQIQQRMARFDECREQVIKDCRDVQKASKQAIFALQRGNLTEADKKLTQAREGSIKILALIAPYPTLRMGALSNALEEWAEGMLLLHWLRTRSLPSREAMGLVSASEYIGGLSDFTGEVGRIAVALAAKRDLDGVREILQVDMVVQQFIAQANASGNRFGKKLEAVQTNLRKVEDVVYELVLQQRSHRVSRVKASVPGAPTGTDDAGDS